MWIREVSSSDLSSLGERPYRKHSVFDELGIVLLGLHAEFSHWTFPSRTFLLVASFRDKPPAVPQLHSRLVPSVRVDCLVICECYGVCLVGSLLTKDSNSFRKVTPTGIACKACELLLSTSYCTLIY